MPEFPVIVQVLGEPNSMWKEEAGMTEFMLKALLVILRQDVQ